MKTIPLTQGYSAIVDDDDFDRVSQFKWVAWVKKREGKTEVYAIRTFRRPHKQQRTVQLHRFVMDVWDGRLVDHRNHDSLDCRKVNLRVCTHAQNTMNSRKRRDGSSQYKGVRFISKLKKWSVRITVNGQRRYVGFYLSEEEAARAYNDAARQHFGEFACLNQLSA